MSGRATAIEGSPLEISGVQRAAVRQNHVEAGPRALGPGGASPGGASPGLPSVNRQKEFIVENAGILNRETRLAILNVVMMEIGPDVVMETNGAREVDIDLDAATAANEEVLGHIYNIVRGRLETLNQPARPGGAEQGGGGPRR